MVFMEQWVPGRAVPGLGIPSEGRVGVGLGKSLGIGDAVSWGMLWAVRGRDQLLCPPQSKDRDVTTMQRGMISLKS